MLLKKLQGTLSSPGGQIQSELGARRAWTRTRAEGLEQETEVREPGGGGTRQKRHTAEQGVSVLAIFRLSLGLRLWSDLQLWSVEWSNLEQMV